MGAVMCKELIKNPVQTASKGGPKEVPLGPEVFVADCLFGKKEDEKPCRPLSLLIVRQLRTRATRVTVGKGDGHVKPQVSSLFWRHSHADRSVERVALAGRPLSGFVERLGVRSCSLT